MGVEGCHRVIKNLTIFFNLLLFGLGITVMGVAIYAKNTSDDFNYYFVVIDETNSTWENYVVLCIIVGVIVMLLGGCGCYGAAKESQMCLGFFATLMFIVFILEIVAGGMGYHYHDSLESTIKKGMEKTFNTSIQTVGTVHNAWSYVQRELKCCGINNNMDYFKYDVVESQMIFYCGSKWRELSGCYNKVKNELEGKWRVWAGAAVGIAIVELIAIVFAILLIREIRRGDSKGVVSLSKIFENSSRLLRKMHVTMEI